MRVAIIPARGGSKRILRKNIKLFHRKPIIAYSIEAAVSSGCFDKVIVSTDDPEIAAISEEYGASVPFLRPANVADDYATTMEVIQHFIQWGATQNLHPTYICCIYATAPFIRISDLLNGYQLVQQNGVQYCFTATEFSYPIQRALCLSSAGNVNMVGPEYEFTRTQDLPVHYHDAAQFYWGKASSFERGLSIFSSHSRVVVVAKEQSQDIDTLEDWDFAEALFSAKQK